MTTTNTGPRLTTITTPTGDRVTLDRYGPSGAPSVLFIAGAGPTRASDQETSQTAALVAASGFQASVHDRVGRGDSAAEGAISLERELQAIEAIATELAVANYMVDMPPEWLEGLKQSPAYPALVNSWVPDGTALANVEPAGLEEALKDVTVPVLAVVGTETFPGMVESAERIAAAAPDGTYEVVTGAWHSWEPEAMAARLVDFLQQVR